MVYRSHSFTGCEIKVHIQNTALKRLCLPLHLMSRDYASEKVYMQEAASRNPVKELDHLLFQSKLKVYYWQCSNLD